MTENMVSQYMLVNGINIP